VTLIVPTQAPSRFYRRRIRVLIVDDSPTQRQLIARHLTQDGRFAVVGAAAGADEARRLLPVCAPDVMTLDVDMPGQDGVTFLKVLMRERPMAVVMLSASTPAGSDAALEALRIGAVDCLEKGRSALTPGPDSLAERVAVAARVRIVQKSAAQHGPVQSARTSREPARPLRAEVCLIGASTGGVVALEEIVMGWPADCPATAVVQHMPARYITRFAERLNRGAAPQVKVAEDGEPLRPGLILFAPGNGMDLTIRAEGRNLKAALVPHDSGLGAHCPSVEALFRSAVVCADRTLAVLLTGMGHDGVAAMGHLRRAGAQTLAQDQASCAIFGMPGAALASGAASRAVPLSAMAAEILGACGARGGPQAADGASPARP
jgi:two-component system chemotaxis response regulator CheB